MKDASTIGTVRIRVAMGLLALAVASACAPKAARRQTDIMEKSGAVGVSAAVLRARLNELADRLAGRLEYTADRIRESSRDPAVRRRALDVKVDGIPAVYTAAYRSDPLAGAMDVWGLTFQIRQYVEDGAGREWFGSQQPLAREGAHEMLADADTFVQGIAIRPEAFAKARVVLQRWANEHPIEHRLSSRASFAINAAQLRSDELDAFVAVGTVSDTIENLSDRLNTYAALLPKQARWQAEILATEMAGEHGVEGALGDVHDMGAAARRVSDVLGDVPGLLDAAGSPVGEMLAAERRAVLEGVDGQRVQTLEYLTTERLAVLAAVREERIALVAALRQERIESLAEVDAIGGRSVGSVMAGLRELVDYTLWRVTALCLFLIFSAATVGVIGYRLTIGRRRSAAS